MKEEDRFETGRFPFVHVVSETRIAPEQRASKLGEGGFVECGAAGGKPLHLSELWEKKLVEA